ncbi:S41 family peptidase [Motilibacter aurantiacus]|uniref:S41 family peptidase n=1 Tax=Motilibacter aurantiacus TaxID=2714955 RepID=UPI00140ABCC2|nr:S41 family peptidase [Motilibacter aurantiacus]NHC45295.1 PDZ domain-containing protein [Motilibacter aurantiacus]
MRSLRRVAGVGGIVAGLLIAYAAGVLTGVLADGDGPPRSAATAAGAGPIEAAAERIATGAARSVDRATLEQAAISGMLTALGDRWASYYPPSEYASYADALEGRYTGVGLWLRAEESGSGTPADDSDPAARVVVGSVTPGSPAARARVAVGDVLLGIDGQRPGSVARAATLLRGRDGTSVRLELSGERTGRRTLDLVRTTFETRDVAVRPLDAATRIVSVGAFTRGVGREVRDQLAKARQARDALVLDLRGNPGGLLDEAVEVASAFLDGGTVVSYERRGEQPRRLDAVGEGDTATPLVVLVDAGTASAAEVVAAALQDRGRAVVVGARTYGKGSVQEGTELPDGSALELTVGHYRTPSGRDIDGTGVAPDIAVAARQAPSVAERRAVEVLRGLRAARTPPAVPTPTRAAR